MAVTVVIAAVILWKRWEKYCRPNQGGKFQFCLTGVLALSLPTIIAVLFFNIAHGIIRGRLAPRHALERIWLVTRVIFTFLGVTLLIAFWMRDGARSHEKRYVSIFSALLLFLACIATPSNRRRAVAWIGSMNSHKADAELAALSALVGGDAAEETAKAAECSFRLVPFDALRGADDLPGFGTGPADQKALRALASDGAMGDERSVFVSHSWHDDRPAKWDALREWAEHERAQRGAEPLLWLDAACVSPDVPIDRSLAMLPLYLAGTQRMVVLLGETYLERLWCVMELFCFLRMGGSPSRVTVVPVLGGTTSTTATEDQFKAHLARFDVARAQCAKDGDTQRLLACIEVGFGTYVSFNEFIRTTFAAQMWLPVTCLPDTEGHARSDAASLSKTSSTASMRRSVLQMIRSSVGTRSRPGRTQRGQLSGAAAAAPLSELPMAPSCPRSLQADAPSSMCTDSLEA